MTDFKLVFKFKDLNTNKKLNIFDDFFKIPFWHIAK